MQQIKYGWINFFILSLSLITFSPRSAIANGSDLPDINIETDPTEAELFIQPVFNFNPPGARSLGMGATFIGIADDATAAESNPAGLVILTEPEASVNFRVSSNTTIAEDPYSRFFKRTSSFTDTTSGPSFLSYVHPLEKENLAISIYYHQASNLKSHEEFKIDHFQESNTTFDMLTENFGVSIAAKLNQKLSIGASLRYTRFDLNLANQRSVFVLDTEHPFFEGTEGDPLLNRYEALDESVDDSDANITFNAGILINPDGKLSLGLVYKQGSDFQLKANVVETFLFPELCDFKVSLTTPLLGSVSIPSSIGAGFAFRPNSHWILGLDLLRITYSDLKGAFTSDDSEQIEDETEIHFGLEYGFTFGASNTPVFLRGGFYTNPDHDGTSAIDSNQEFITFGAGAFFKEKFQLDAGFSFSDDTTESLLSMVWRL